MNRSTLNKFLPLILAIGPIVLFVVLFILAALLMEGADSFGVGEKTDSQKDLQPIADFTALTAAGTFTFIMPIGFIAGIVLLIARLNRKRK